MNWTFIVGALCGATIVLIGEAIMIIGLTLKGLKDGVLGNETTKTDTEEI